MQNPQENAFARNIFNKVAPTSLKEALAQVLSPELCEMFKHTFLQNTSGRLLLFLVSHCMNIQERTDAVAVNYFRDQLLTTQAFTCSTLTMETLEQGVKDVQR